MLILIKGRSREKECCRIAILGKPVNDNATWITKIVEFGDLIESLAYCIIDCSSEDINIIIRVDFADYSMANGYMYPKIRILKRILDLRRLEMRSDMVDSDKRDPKCFCIELREAYAYKQ